MPLISIITILARLAIDVKQHSKAFERKRVVRIVEKRREKLDNESSLERAINSV